MPQDAHPGPVVDPVSCRPHILGPISLSRPFVTAAPAGVGVRTVPVAVHLVTRTDPALAIIGPPANAVHRRGTGRLERSEAPTLTALVQGCELHPLLALAAPVLVVFPRTMLHSFGRAHGGPGEGADPASLHPVPQVGRATAALPVHVVQRGTDAALHLPAPGHVRAALAAVVQGVEVGSTFLTPAAPLAASQQRARTHRQSHLRYAYLLVDPIMGRKTYNNLTTHIQQSQTKRRELTRLNFIILNS
jgi:hypothetical protein